MEGARRGGGGRSICGGGGGGGGVNCGYNYHKAGKVHIRGDNATFQQYLMVSDAVGESRRSRRCVCCSCCCSCYYLSLLIGKHHRRVQECINFVTNSPTAKSPASQRASAMAPSNGKEGPAVL